MQTLHSWEMAAGNMSTCQQLKMSAFSDAGKVKGMKQMHGI